MNKINTLIELFDECQLENVVAALYFNPKKIIYVGYSKIMTKKRINDLKKFFSMKNRNFELEFVFVSRYDFNDVSEKINEIVSENRGALLDLTGGKELVVAAIGERLPDSDVNVFQIDIKTGAIKNIFDSEKCNELPVPLPIEISVEEMIALNGGVAERNENKNLMGNVSLQDKELLKKMWNICKKDFALWNKQTGLLCRIESMGTVSGNDTAVSLTDFDNSGIADVLSEEFFSLLRDEGIILDFSKSKYGFKIVYRNERIKKWLLKSGNILEIYIYLTANEIAKENPDFYTDIDMGVFVDWDGEIKRGDTPSYDTKNEIDILIMHGLTPVFISCKNGAVEKEALYELEAVADKFGGKYAKKFIVASNISSATEPHKKSFLHRAHDMGITVIDEVSELSYEDFKEKFKRTVT